MKDEYRTFVQNLRRYMDIKHINQRGLAAVMNVSTATTSDWYNGEKLPRMDKLEKLADILDVTVADLMADEADVDFEIELTVEGKQTLFLMEKMAPAQQKALFEYAKLLSQMK